MVSMIDSGLGHIANEDDFCLNVPFLGLTETIKLRIVGQPSIENSRLKRVHYIYLTESSDGFPTIENHQTRIEVGQYDGMGKDNCPETTIICKTY